MTKIQHNIINVIPLPFGKAGMGFYIHIPFCKQACHYCDFHFSTTMKNKENMVLALAKEIEIRKTEFENEVVESIYFGGGTPSVLNVDEINFLLETVYKNYKITENPEITLEANPDDLTEEKIIELSKTKINRLSIGIQSFFEDDLKLMNRAHNAVEAEKCLKIVTQYFKNISVDLIYGMPNMSNEKWLKNIETVLKYNIPHISSYVLTVEPKTALQKMIKTGEIPKLDDENAQQHFNVLLEKMHENGYIHYEISSFGKTNYFSRNNTSYWLGKKYIGIGPSAHSFNGLNRSWNVSNNVKYIKNINENILPNETETLTQQDLFNEYIMTGLRTIWGVSLEKIKTNFGEKHYIYLLKQAEKHLKNELLIIEENVLKSTNKGKFFIDGIASDLFMV